MPSNQNERRLFSAGRISARIAVDVFLGNEEIHNTHSVNVSQSGLLLEHPIPKEIGDVFDVHLHLPKQSRISVLTKVARHLENKGSPCTALQILEMSSESQEKWLEYISQVESFASGKEEKTTASQFLIERRKSGKNKRQFLMQFKSRSDLEIFCEDKLSMGKLFIDISLSKTPGDEVFITLLHPETGGTYLLKSHIADSAIATVSKEAAKKGLTLIIDDLDEAELRAFVASDAVLK